MESLNTAILTSKYVVYNNSTIVYVAHHSDGTWEFWGKEEIDESEIVVVSLREMIAIDSTILNISDLPVGFVAVREMKDKPWEIISKN